MLEILKAFVITGLAWVLSAWSLMLTVGIAHADWWPLIPLMGFHAALAIVSVAIMILIISVVIKTVFGIAD